MSDRDLVRLALHYAIEEREGWLASVGSPASEDDAPHVERAQRLIAGWQRILAKRYGERPMSYRLIAGSTAQITDDTP